MEGFVAQKLNDFETGKISRRKLIETLTLAATAGASERAVFVVGPDGRVMLSKTYEPEEVPSLDEVFPLLEKF